MTAATRTARRAAGGGIVARRKRHALNVEIVSRAGGWAGLGPITAKIRKCAQAAQRAAGAQGMGGDGGTVVIALSGDVEVRMLNASYRGKDKPTNVLSFPVAERMRASDPSRPLGDVILSYETVVAEAEERGTSVADHLQHLVVHGVLHLLGYDHEHDADALRMEQLESQIMLSLGVSDPHAVD